jgi:hypothetical protein
MIVVRKTQISFTQRTKSRGQAPGESGSSWAHSNACRPHKLLISSFATRGPLFSPERNAEKQSASTRLCNRSSSKSGFPRSPQRELDPPLHTSLTCFRISVSAAPHRGVRGRRAIHQQIRTSRGSPMAENSFMNIT